MTAQFQYVLDDYMEASRALGRRRAAKPRHRFLDSLPILIAFALALAVGLWTLPARMPGIAAVGFALAPAVLMRVTMVVVGAAMSLGPGKPRIGWHDLPALVFFVVPAVGVAVAAIYWSISDLPDFPAWGWALSANITWLGVVVWLAIGNRRASNAAWRQSWTDTPSLHRTKTLEITADGETIIDAVTRYELRWGAFIDREETRSLFMLYLSPINCLFIPKRAFPGDEELRAMQALMGLVPAKCAGGFPVEPVKASESAS